MGRALTPTRHNNILVLYGILSFQSLFQGSWDELGMLLCRIIEDRADLTEKFPLRLCTQISLSNKEWNGENGLRRGIIKSVMDKVSLPSMKVIVDEL